VVCPAFQFLFVSTTAFANVVWFLSFIYFFYFYFGHLFSPPFWRCTRVKINFVFYIFVTEHMHGFNKSLYFLYQDKCSDRSIYLSKFLCVCVCVRARVCACVRTRLHAWFYVLVCNILKYSWPSEYEDPLRNLNNSKTSMNMTVDTTINERISFSSEDEHVFLLYMHWFYAACFDLYIGHEAFIYEL
jgi:hypothetical protein